MPFAYGPNHPSNAGQYARTGATSWTTITNITASDNAYAQVNMPPSDRSFFLYSYNHGFAIPSGAVIQGIELLVEKKSGGYNDWAVYLTSNGGPLGDNKAASGVFWPTTDSGVVYGGPADLWGRSWTAAEINASGFGGGIQARNPTIASQGGTVDRIAITVYTEFTEPPTPIQTCASPLNTRIVSVPGAAVWSNSSNVKAIDGNTADCQMLFGDTSDYLVVDNFNLNIPQNHQLSGMVFTMWQTSTPNAFNQGSVYDLEVCPVKDGNILTHINKAKPDAWQTDSTQTSYTYGQSGDTWASNTFWPQNLNSSGFGFAIRVKTEGLDPNITAKVDYMGVCVYTFPTSGVKQAMYFGMHGYDLNSGVLPFYIDGVFGSSSGLPVYMSGIGYSSEFVDLMMPAGTGTARALNISISGALPGVTTYQELFIEGYSVWNSGLPIYVSGRGQMDTYLDLFMEGSLGSGTNVNMTISGTYPQLNGLLDLFIDSRLPGNDNNIPVYISGQEIVTNNLTLFLGGVTTYPVATGLQMFIANYSSSTGTDSMLDSVPMFLDASRHPQDLTLFLAAPTSAGTSGQLTLFMNGAAYPIAAAVPMYLANSGSVQTLPLFLKNQSNFNNPFASSDGFYPFEASGITLFIQRPNDIAAVSLFLNANVNETGMPLYVFGAQGMESNVPLFMPSGTDDFNGNVELYTHGY